jgi:protein associated with RNAse G/E
MHPPIDQVQVWPALTAGDVLDVLKVGFDGSIKARYPGIVVDAGAPAPWIAVACSWTMPTTEADGLTLVTGDTLIEYFSPAHPFNAFRVLAPDGTLRGCYANVTYPTVVSGVTLEWHDLWLDLIVLPDGSFDMRDQDELEESGIAESDPQLYAAIVAAGGELVRLATERAFPFDGA